jgi:ribosome biogenesis GTPase
VLAAIEDGSLTERRLESYRKLLREAAYQERRGNARLMAAERAKWKSISKQTRDLGLSRP